MIRKLLICLISTFLIFQSVLLAPNAKGSPYSRMLEIKSDSFTQWNDSKFNFYSVYNGEIVKTNLILQNTSDKILEGSIRSSISFFTISPVDQFSLTPGEEIIFDLTLDVTGEEYHYFSGERVYIHTNYENIQIPVSFSIQPKISNIEIDIDSQECFVNGKEEFIGDRPRIFNGRTLVSSGLICWIFGAKAEYSQNAHSLTYIFRASEVVMINNNPIAKLNGKEILMDVPAKILAGRFYVPLRFIVEEFLGASVDWDPIEHKILITYDLSKQPQP